MTLQLLEGTHLLQASTRLLQASTLLPLVGCQRRRQEVEAEAEDVVVVVVAEEFLREVPPLVPSGGRRCLLVASLRKTPPWRLLPLSTSNSPHSTEPMID